MAEVDGGVSIYLGMLLVVMIANWNKALDQTKDGEINIWSAIWTAVGGLVATICVGSILRVSDNDADPLLIMGAAIAGIVSLILQSVSWWQPGVASGLAGPAVSNLRPFNKPPISPEVSDGQSPAREGTGRGVPFTPDPGPDGRPYHTRWGITRAVWGLLAFVLMGGAIVSFVATLVAADNEIRYDEATGLIVVCVACMSAMIFAVRKTTPVKRLGFWLESMRPLLMSLALFGIGATITGIARNWEYLCEDDRGGVIAGLVISTVLLSVSMAKRGRKPSAQKPFFSPSRDVRFTCDGDKAEAVVVDAKASPNPPGGGGVNPVDKVG
jgi:hypothetical protein